MNFHELAGQLLQGHGLTQELDRSPWLAGLVPDGSPRSNVSPCMRCQDGASAATGCNRRLHVLEEENHKQHVRIA